tara:strand:- start:4106 stop:5329 length:1224 start_codon:yes stop_codon:yes gene_type:complete
MRSEDPVGIIEIGDKKITCLIFKINNNNLEVLSTNTNSSEGFYNDKVTNLTKATNAVRSCISDAEKKAKISLKKINVIFEQPDFLCTKFSKHKKINGAKILRDDIEFLLKEAKKQLIYNDNSQSIIHIFNYNYVVDGKNFVEEPIDVYADSLTHEMTFITAPKNNLKNINQIFIDCDIEVDRFISRTFTLGVKLLNDKELQFGSAIINLGFEKVSLGIFKNLALVYSLTIPIGINHIIKDISKVCSLNLEESEIIKKKFDFSFENNFTLFDDNSYLKKDFFVSSNFRKISKNLIFDVIKARLDEIFIKLKRQLVLPNFSLSSGMKILLLSEETELNNIEKYCQNFFGQNIIKKSENNNKHKDSEKNFISSLGALKIIKDGWETEAIPKNRDRNFEKMGFFAKIFKNI